MFDHLTQVQKDAALVGGGVLVAGILVYFLWPSNDMPVGQQVDIAGLPGARTAPAVPLQPIMIDVSGPVSSVTAGASYVFATLANGLSKAALLAQLQATGWTSTTDLTQPPAILFYPGTAAASYTDGDPQSNWPADLPWPADSVLTNTYFAAAGTYTGTSPLAITGTIAMQYIPTAAIDQLVYPAVMFQGQPIWMAAGGGLYVANFGICGSPQKMIAVGYSQLEVSTKAASVIMAACGVSQVV